MARGTSLALLLALALPGPAAAGEFSPAESRLRTQAAEAVVEFAAWCAKEGARTEGVAALEEARELDHLARGFHEAELAFAEVEKDTADPEAVAKRRRSDGRAVAKFYDRLAALGHEEKEKPRFEGYLFRALSWEPTDARTRKVAAAVEDAAAGSRPEEAGRLLQGLKRADAEGAAKGRYDAIEQRLAQKDALLLGSPTHPLMAFVSLPRGWAKGRGYPILVAVDGAGCAFLGCARGYAESRGSRPVIVVSPCTLSNTNDLAPDRYRMYPPALLQEWNGNRIAFDGEGMEALLAEVRRKFGGEERVLLTGFSGGGNYCYYKLLRDPGGVRGAAPACANFAGYGVEGAPGAGEGGGPPVHILTGEKDPHREFTFGNRDSPGIEPQTDRAVAALEKLGFTRVRRTMVKGAGHSPLRKEVWEFVDGVLEGR